MTGFGKSEVERENVIISIELKSVNHRFKDIRFKMSSVFAPIEIELRNLIAESFKRGSFEVFINYKKIESQKKFEDIDYTRVETFVSSFKEVSEKLNLELSIRPTDFLRSEFLIDQDDKFQDQVLEMVREGFPSAIKALKESRKIEGQKMTAVLENHIKEYKEHFEVVEQKAETFQFVIKERLEKKFADMKTSLPVDEPRFMQEVIFYMEKMDVHEEINRIKAHLEKFHDLLSKGGEVGRQIDFLIQELNRETNTTGSKSTVEEISAAVVQMKVHLEKIREQGLNLE